MPRIIEVHDPDDPRIAAYRNIREHDLVGRQGLFIAEGDVVVRTLIGRSRHRPLSLLLAKKRLAALAPLVGALPESVPVYLAEQPVLDGIAGFPLHRGILGMGSREPDRSPEALLAGAAPCSLFVMLVGIANHDNVGGIFRNAAAFGADGILLDSDCCDPLYRKAIRVSVGAALAVPFARLGAGADPVGTLLAAGFEPIALSPAGSTPLAQFRRPGRAAVLFGAEGPGLPAALLARCRTIRIPMAAGFDSLNVATTSGIVLHHLAEPPR